jgi:AcrR family transcriptional regulator
VVAVKRRAKAEATRARIIASAYGLFCENGYRASTMDLIAHQAGVAVQTVYFTFHTKDDLLKAVFEWTVLGDDGVPPHRQAWHLDALAEPDGYRALPKIVAGIGAIDARMAPMIGVFSAVAQDPAGAIYQQSEEMRRADMAQLADALARKTPLRKGVTRRRAADLLFVLTGPALYRDFVLEAGWPPRDWTRWVTDTLIRDLLPDHVTGKSAAPRKPRTGARPGQGT